MKNWQLCVMTLFFAGCSEQLEGREALFSDSVAVVQAADIQQDTVMSLLWQARQGDGTAYLKLADCYRDGKGVKKDFLGMITMAGMAEGRGATNRLEDYIEAIPNGHEYKTLFMLMDSYKLCVQDSVDSIVHAIENVGGIEAQTFIGLITVNQGDTITGMKMMRDAAEQGCSLAELLLAIPNWKADATRLSCIADRVPIAYTILGNLYYEPDKNGNTNRQLAVEYYMKAEEHAVLGKSGAERVLDYHKNGGNVLLTKDDVRRLELITGQHHTEE